jgi:hypothetical protein
MDVFRTLAAAESVRPSVGELIGRRDDREGAKRAGPRGWSDRVPLPTKAASQTGRGLPVGEQSEQPAS